MSSSTFEDIVKEFVRSTRYARSVDWILIKLSSAISALEDAYRYSGSNTYDIVNKFLKHDEVRQVLAQLSCNLEDVENLLSTARFRSLAKYRDLIIETLRSLPCTTSILQTTRPPTYYIEYSEERSEHKMQHNLLRPRISTLISRLDPGVKCLIKMLLLSLVLVSSVLVLIDIIM